MANFSISPRWFLPYTLFFEFFLAAMTFVVAIYSFKVYNLTSQKKSKYFGLTFLSFSLAYAVQFLLNFSIFLALGDITNINSFVYLTRLLNILGAYVHAFFFTLGLLILVLMVFNNKKNSGYLVLFLTILFSWIYYQYDLGLFYIVSSLLFLYASFFYYKIYLKNKRFNQAFVFIAFFFMFLSHVHFFLSVDHELFFVIGSFLELIAYILILVNLIFIKNARKKK